MKVLQKDRHHTINRYKHLRETDPAEAEQLRVQMAEHLRKVDGQLTMALGMLDRVPTFKKKVEMQIRMQSFCYYHANDAFSPLTLLVGWQEGHPACKNSAMRYWHGYLSGVRCK